jgi:NAD(P)-dependent dehydrogenase (short-subunit alcohol dehydrogenase family)
VASAKNRVYQASCLQKNTPCRDSHNIDSAFAGPHSVGAPSSVRLKTFGADTPMKRPAQPEEVAPAFVFFASNAG